MKITRQLITLILLAGLLAVCAACAGLFWPGGSGKFTFTSLQGQSVEMFGRGIYHNDSFNSAATYVGTDVVTLVLMVPALLVALWFSRNGSLRWRLLLLGVLGAILYNSFHMAFAVAYNPLFVLYVVFFATSLYAFLMLFASVDLKDLGARLAPNTPRRGPAIFLIVAGTILGLVWLSDILPPLLTNQPPLSLGSSTTLVTYALDLAVIVPGTILAGRRILRREPLGYLLGVVLLVINAIVGIIVVSQTLAQVALGGPLSLFIVLVFAAPFVGLAGFATWFTAGVLRNINDLNFSKSPNRDSDH